MKNNNYFDVFFDRWIDRVHREFQPFLLEKCKELMISIDGIITGVKKELRQICVRTLITEFEVCNRLGKLEGTNTCQKLQCYKEKFLNKEEYVDMVLDRYPVLRECCDNVVVNQLAYAKEVLENLLKDKSLIENEILQGCIFSKIHEMKIGCGDKHRGGKSVVEFKLDCGICIYYKPRSSEGDVFFCQVLDRLDMKTGSNGYWDIYRLLSVEDHSWVRKVEYVSCKTEEETVRFYQRIGIMLAVSYYLGSHDFHYQNLIAHGEFPVLVDLELLFDSDRKGFDIEKDNKMEYSILTSGLLPGSVQESKLCAVTGGNGEMFTYRTPQVVVDQDGIRIELKEICMETGKNLPKTGIRVTEYLQDIQRGFEMAYDAIRNSDIQDLISGLNENMYCRHLVKSTQIYQSILSTSYHPSLLLHPGDREQYIRKMCRCEIRQEGKWESEALLRGDIPCFERKLNGKDLFENGHVVCEQYFCETVQEALDRRMMEMGAFDRKLQISLIAFSLRLAGVRMENQMNEALENACVNGVYRDKEEKNWGEIRHEIAERIATAALVDSENERVMWLALQCIAENGNLGICKMNYYLYAGISGIAVALRQMNIETGKYGELCRLIDNELFQYTDGILTGKRKVATEYTGLLEGEASLVAAYLVLYHITHRAKYVQYAQKHAGILENMLTGDCSYDLLYGNAGAIIALCILYRMTMKRKYLEMAVTAEQVIKKQVIDEDFTHILEKGDEVCWGMAHGMGGLMLCYGFLTSCMPKQMKYKRMLLYLFKECAAEDKYPKDNLPSWCRGRLGVVASKIFIMKELLQDAESELHLGKAEIDILKKSCLLRKGMCLCHGNIGNLIILKYCARHGYLDEEYLELFESQVLRGFGNEMLVSEKENYGMMTGICGVNVRMK